MRLEEQELREWVQRVAHGQASRRQFMRTMLGRGGKLRLLSWQAPTILNPHLAVATKDSNASRVVYEPLFFVNPDGDFIPILAEEIPSFENGGRARDGTWTPGTSSRGWS